MLQIDVGLEGIDRFLGFDVESIICSSLLAMEADTSTTVYGLQIIDFSRFTTRYGFACSSVGLKLIVTG